MMGFKNEIKKSNNLNLVIHGLKGLVLPKNCIIAGGCFKNIILGEKVKDYDLFFLTHEDYFEGIKFYKSLNFQIVYQNDNAIRFYDGTNNYEIISYIYKDVNDLLSKFDFELTKIAVTTKMVKNIDNDELYVLPNELYYSDKALFAIDNRILTFDRSCEQLVAPVSTLKRVIRHVENGYTIRNQDLYFLVDNINEMDKSDIFLEFYEGDGN
jgi:hypothetical protein